MKYLAAIVILFTLTGARRSDVEMSTFTFSPFGTVRLYPAAASAEKERLTLFVTGDGGWSPTMNHLAEMLVHRGSAVVSINIAPYIKALRAAPGACGYPAGDFENLAKAAEKQLGFHEYHRPLLIGYSSGATLVYAALNEAPKSFLGALSLGFCPDFPVTKPLCKGRGLQSKPDAKAHGVDFLPDASLEAKWIVFQGDSDQVCAPASTEEFTRAVKDAEFILLPKVGHGFSVWDRWHNQFDEAFHRLIDPEEMSRSALPNLPLVELPASAAGDTMAVIVSGDGGWAGIDRDIAGELAQQGMPVVGFDSLHYFWTARTPAEAAHALEEVIDHYSTAWNRKRVLLVGYSFGADVLPFMLTRISPASASLVSDVFLLGLDQKAEFEFHIGDWVGSTSGHAYRTQPELLSVRGPTLHCFYGKDDADDLCRTLPKEKVHQIMLSGGHHFNGDYRGIADRIIESAKLALRRE
ncbi:MAG: AcvB/VirJ family lysyl-phosphatidylglycerol hydrolase [Bdellovibrionota bacterium]